MASSQRREKMSMALSPLSEECRLLYMQPLRHQVFLLNQVLAVEYKTCSYYFELSSACDKSSTISSMSSMPIDSLTSSGGEPAAIS